MRIFTSFVLSVPLMLMPSCPGAGDLMRLYGYAEISPPSTLLAPGSLITVESRNPLRVKPLCGPRASLGASFRPRVSVTASHELKSHQGRRFSIAAPVMDNIRGDSRFREVLTITASIQDPKIIELDDDDVVTNLRYRSLECQQAVALRRANGFPVTMVSSALMGNVVYTVTFATQQSVDAKVKIDTMKELARELGAGVSTVTTSQVYANGLVIGLRDDAYLAAITLDRVDARQFSPDARLIPPQETARIVDAKHPDAPVVLPPRKPDGTLGARPPRIPGGETIDDGIPIIEVRE